MAVPASSVAHLAQEPLSQNDQDILAELAAWVAQAAFDPQTNLCTDAGINEKLASLGKMDLVQKFPNPIYQIRRSSPLMPKLFNPRALPSSLYAMVALRILDGSPTVIGIVEQQHTHKDFRVGWITYIKDKVEITPTVDILFIASRSL
ncbi:MAG: hypothetical protein Q9173_006707 [Seirophora scorigena]